MGTLICYDAMDIKPWTIEDDVISFGTCETDQLLFRF